jgi:hypothetical protein
MIVIIIIEQKETTKIHYKWKITIGGEVSESTKL